MYFYVANNGVKYSKAAQKVYCGSEITIQVMKICSSSPHFLYFNLEQVYSCFEKGCHTNGESLCDNVESYYGVMVVFTVA